MAERLPKRARVAMVVILIALLGAAAFEGAWDYWFPPRPPAKLTRDQILAEGRAATQALQTKWQQEQVVKAAADNRQAAQTLAQEEIEITKLFASATYRWTPLPRWCENVFITPSGDALFRSGGNRLNGDAFKASVEKVVAGTSRIVEGTLLRVDSVGRYWGYFSAFPDNHLLGYDPKSHQWIERTLAFQDAFIPTSLEDSAGNLWFISASFKTGVTVHRFNPDGTWTDLLLRTVHNATGSFLPTDWDLIESPQGVVSISKTHEVNSRAPAPVVISGGSVVHATNDLFGVGHPGLFRLRSEPAIPATQPAPGDDSLVVGPAWDHFTPAICRDHPTVAVFPLPDGDIASLCEMGRLRIHPVMTDERLKALLDRLADADSTVRDGATDELRKLDPAWLKRAAAASAQALPEARSRVHSVMSSQSDAEPYDDVPEQEEHPVYGNRFTFGDAKLLRRCSAITHGPIFAVEDLFDQQSGQRMDHAIVSVTTSANGNTWSAVALPADWNTEDVDPWKEAFETRDGRLWLDSGVVIDPKTGAVDRPVPPHMKIYGQDKDGRVYFQGFIFNPAAPANPPPLPVQTVAYHGDLVRASDGVIWTWPGPDDSAPLCRFVNGAWQVVPGAPEAPGKSLIPLKNGAMLVVVAMGSDRAALFDGTGWHTSADLQSLISENRKILHGLLPNHFDRPMRLSVAQDDSGVIWESFKDWVWYLDASGNWHELADAISADSADDVPNRMVQKTDPFILPSKGLVLHTLLGAARVQVQPDGTCLIIRYTAHPDIRFHMIMLPRDGPDVYQLPVSYAANGDVIPSSGHVVFHADGATDEYANNEDFADQEFPQCIDNTNRLWSITRRSGVVVHASATDKASVQLGPFRSDQSTMLTASDGVAWIVSTAGIDEIQTTGSGAQPQLSAAPRRGWDSPFTSTNWNAVLDSDGGLWVCKGDSSACRYALPNAVERAKPMVIIPPRPNGAFGDPMLVIAPDETVHQAIDAAAALWDGAAQAPADQFVDILAPLRAVAASLPAIPVGSRQGNARWQKVTLNRFGNGRDAVHFKVPSGPDCDLQFGIVSPPHSYYSWELGSEPDANAMENSPHDQSEYLARSLIGFNPPPASHAAIYSLGGQQMCAGHDYVLFFKFENRDPLQMQIAVNLLPEFKTMDLGTSMGLEGR